MKISKLYRIINLIIFFTINYVDAISFASFNSIETANIKNIIRKKEINILNYKPVKNLNNEFIGKIYPVNNNIKGVISYEKKENEEKWNIFYINGIFLLKCDWDININFDEMVLTLNKLKEFLNINDYDLSGDFLIGLDRIAFHNDEETSF